MRLHEVITLGTEASSPPLNDNPVELAAMRIIGPLKVDDAIPQLTSRTVPADLAAITSAAGQPICRPQAG